jgi:transcriptional regulator with XRE-family HTH domain
MLSLCVMHILLSSPFYTPGEEAQALPGTRKHYIAPVDEKAIGKRIRDLRKRQGMTQAELATELGVNQSAVSDYEKGEVRIHAAMLAGLAKALKASADEILGLEKAKGNGQAPDRRFLRRIERLHRLSRRDQQAILGTIDAFLSKVS